jgi:hypothetical protein
MTVLVTRPAGVMVVGLYAAELSETDEVMVVDIVYVINQSFGSALIGFFGKAASPGVFL